VSETFNPMKFVAGSEMKRFNY